ncbi:hypothetical protein C2845_PM12G06980 [Panicum miliaceum]|uniref:BED-type domain-containing protein n=1 Tax=Panicum miliaceum TaxID=4540 RepID=A0A3L6QDP2_PANMI|nr:hypothetical protein C2845_PM12G06980 [Panicum miliaceum]
MEDEEEVQGMLPLVAASLESSSKRKKTPSATGNRSGRGRGRGRGSADTDTHIEPLAEDEDNGQNFDMNAASAISISVPTDDDADDDASQQEDGDDVSMPSNPSKPTRGWKKLKAGTGIRLSPSKTKVKRGKRADCWKYFKEIHVQSEEEFGVMETKAKCRFCHKSYVYHPGGATSQLNRHLFHCTQF